MCIQKFIPALHVFQKKGTKVDLKCDFLIVAILAVLGGFLPLPKPVIRSYVRSSEIPSWVEGCVNLSGMAPAALSRDVELIKPAGLHFVEEKPWVTMEMPVKYTSLPVLYTSSLSNAHLSPSTAHSYKLMSPWWDMQAGFARE